MDMGPADMTAPMIMPIIDVAPDLVGFPSALDAGRSTDTLGRPLTFAWHFISVPAGSTIDDSKLMTVTATQVKFEPDLGGIYTVQLTVTAGSDSAMTSNAVNVPTVPIFFQQANFGVVQDSAVGLIRSDGTGRKVVSCTATQDAGAGQVFAFGLNAYFSTHAFDPPAGGSLPARFAFTLQQGSEVELFVADETSDCVTNTPPRVDEAGSMYSNKPHQLPRFSPDGGRVIFVDDPGSATNTSRLVSANVNGLSLRVIRGTNGSVNLNTAPPVWVDATHVAWVENTGTPGAPLPKIYTASDAASAGDTSPTPLLDCSAMFPILNQFAILPDGTLLISAGAMKKSAGGSLNLYHVSGPGCTVVATLDTEPAGGETTDFQVAPDGNTVVLASTHGQTNDGGAETHDLYTLTVDGAKPLTYFAGAPGVDDFGPRWIAGGRQILWTQGSQLGDGGVGGGGLMIANADGTHQHSLIGESSGAVVIGGSNAGLSCAWAGPLVGGSLASVLALALVLLVLTRRSGGRTGPGPS
jgi:hypothetical protein